MILIKKITLVFLIFFCSLLSYTQISISDKNSQQAHSSALLDLISDDKGFLLPRMTKSQRDNINNPEESLMIFNTDNKCIEIWVEQWYELWCFNSEEPDYWTECNDNITFTYNGSEITYRTVENPETGKCWMDRNLGAVPYNQDNSDTYEPSSNNDYNFYGDFFQWGRADDGHQKINWSCGDDSNCGNPEYGTTEDLSNTDNPGHSLFIISSSAPPFDWRSDNNNNRWNADPVENNPCPEGWRIPTEQEWANEIDSWGGDYENDQGAFLSPLRLVMSGIRNFSSGDFWHIGTHGYYWSKDVNDNNVSLMLRYNEDFAETYSGWRSYGFNVRCIKN